MKMSHRFFLGLAGLSLAATAAVPVFAATPATKVSPQDRQETLIQALVQRFSLNKSDVQQFFQDQEGQRFNEMLTRLGERLTTQVTQGKLTEVQKNAILEKAKEVKAKQDTFRALSQTERETQMKQYRTDLENWAKQQGIDKRYLQDLLGGGHGGPGGGHRGMGGPEGRRGGPRGGMMQNRNVQVQPQIDIVLATCEEFSLWRRRYGN
jgi:hypothetical protein